MVLSFIGDGSASVPCLRLEKENRRGDLWIWEECTSGPTKSHAMSLYPPQMNGDIYATERSRESVLLLNGAKFERLGTDVGISSAPRITV